MGETNHDYGLELIKDSFSNVKIYYGKDTVVIYNTKKDDTKKVKVSRKKAKKKSRPIRPTDTVIITWQDYVNERKKKLKASRKKVLKKEIKKKTKVEKIVEDLLDCSGEITSDIVTVA